jgi:hypothetical protein
MTLTKISVAVAATLALAQSAEARTHHRHHVRLHEAGRHSMAQHTQYFGEENYAYAGTFSGARQETGSSHHLGGRPSAWCGWEMRQLVSSDPGPSYNLARNWVHWGRSGPAGVGAVVVWPHHVGKIVGQENGQWLVQSGNDGHAVRTRVRSIAGVIAIRWG